VSTIPEPGALALIGMGLLGLSRSLRRRMRPDR
nr:PEP-CTERM sorting domain-containing protein [Acidobacteriota bacterium]